MRDWENMAADGEYVAGARKGPGHGNAGSSRRIDRIAAATQYIGADAGRHLFLRDHHAMFGDNRMNGVGGGRRVKAAALLLRACGRTARDHQHEACEYPTPFGCQPVHQNSAVEFARIRASVVVAVNAIGFSMLEAKRL